MNEKARKGTESKTLKKHVSVAEMRELREILNRYVSECDELLERLKESDTTALFIKGWGSLDYHTERLHAAIQNAIGEAKFPAAKGVITTVDENVEQVKAMRKKKP